MSIYWMSCMFISFKYPSKRIYKHIHYSAILLNVVMQYTPCSLKYPTPRIDKNGLSFYWMSYMFISFESISTRMNKRIHYSVILLIVVMQYTPSSLKYPSTRIDKNNAYPDSQSTVCRIRSFHSNITIQ